MGTVEELKRKRNVLGLMNILREFCERRDSVALASMIDRMTHRPGSTDIFLGSERMRVTDMVDDARAAAKALGDLRDKRAVEVLTKALHQPLEVSIAAVVALGKIKDDRAVEPLIETLRDNSSQVRRDAARVLTWMGDERAVGSLTRVLEDDDGYVRMEAEKALDRIKRRIAKR